MDVAESSVGHCTVGTLCVQSCNTGEECSSDVFLSWVILELPKIGTAHYPGVTIRLTFISILDIIVKLS